MCGIAGVFGYGRTDGAVEPAVLARMVSELSHRGPDDEGTYRSPKYPLGLGFRRLSIVDLSAAGHQPMTNGDQSVWLVYNGEIYNHSDHKPLLNSRGHAFQGHSDSETLLKLYEEFGLECLKLLRGMFAFAIWDEKLGRLSLVRDRLGIKPLYYWLGNGELAFASEIKSLLAYPRVSRDVNVDALSHYLTFLATPPPQTLFEGIYKLPAGHSLTIDFGSGPNAAMQYWDAVVPTNHRFRSIEEAAIELKARFAESVRGMLMSDVPYGVFLSGGIDSSANLAVMAEHSPEPVNTFSVGFRRYESYNELHHARKIADHFGAKHHEIVLDEKDVVDGLPSVVRSQDEPVADWSCVPLHFLSRLARSCGVPVIHVGEGSDEIFSGYPGYISRLQLERWWPTLRRVPTAVWAASVPVAGWLARAGIRGTERLTRLLRYAVVEDGRYWGNAIAFKGIYKDALLKGQYWQSKSPAESSSIVDAFYESLEEKGASFDALQRIIYVELKQRLPELLLMKVDKMTMANSVEARVPFLDHELVEFAMSLPESVRIGDGSPKAVLKRSLVGVLPEHILARPKQGFGVPVREWFRNELRDEVRRVLLDARVHEREYFDRRVIAGMLESHQDGSRDVSYQLWTLYNLFQWYEEWMG